MTDTLIDKLEILRGSDISNPEVMLDRALRIVEQHEKGASGFKAPLETGESAEYQNKAGTEASDHFREVKEMVSDALNDCPACNGNDASAPCAYPEGGMKGCLRDKRLESNSTLIRHIAKHLMAHELPVSTNWESSPHLHEMYLGEARCVIAAVDSFKSEISVIEGEPLSCPKCEGQGWWIDVQPNQHSGDAEQYQAQCDDCRGSGFRLMKRESSEERLAEAVAMADEARRYLMESPSHKRKCNIILLRLVQKFSKDPTKIEGESKRESVEHKYSADFLWPSDDGSVAEAGYEFANAKTRDFQLEWWHTLVERIRIETTKIEGEASK